MFNCERKQKSASGWLAQLVERLPYKQDVTGSSPVLPIFKKASCSAAFLTLPTNLPQRQAYGSKQNAANLWFQFLKCIAKTITSYKPNSRRASLKAARTCLYLKHPGFVISIEPRYGYRGSIPYK